MDRVKFIILKSKKIPSFFKDLIFLKVLLIIYVLWLTGEIVNSVMRQLIDFIGNIYR